MMSAMRQKIKMLEQITSNIHIPLSKIRFFVVFKNVELYRDRRRENHIFDVQKWHQLDDRQTDRQTENYKIEMYSHTFRVPKQDDHYSYVKFQYGVKVVFKMLKINIFFQKRLCDMK